MIRYGNNGGSSSIQRARSAASAWASGLMRMDPGKWAVLDTETTGLSGTAEVVQVGIIDGAGNALMDNILVKPTTGIDAGALAVHGLDDKALESALSFPQVLPDIMRALEGRILVIYNAKFDLRILRQSASAHGISLGFSYETGFESANVLVETSGIDCAMLKYSDWFGDFNSKTGKFRWQPLPDGDHSSVGDCRAVLKLIKTMAGVL